MNTIINTGWTPEIETPEKRAAQFELDLAHFVAMRTDSDWNKAFDCDCGACQRVIKEEQHSLDVEISIAQLLTTGQDAHYSRLQDLLEQKRQADENAKIAEWLDDEPTHYDTGLERDGAATGISQPVIF